MSADSMVQTAAQSLGLSGRPNVLTEDYASRNGQEYAAAAWCDEGVTEWARKSGNYDAVCMGTDYAYTVAHAQAFANAGRWHTGMSGIQAGDIVFFSWEGATTDISRIDHVGVVTGTSNGYVLTIEANTGDTVARRVRGAGVIVGYGRPAYPAAANAPAWPGEVLKLQPTMLHDDNVRTWQQRMVDRGWQLTVDGWYGQQSKSICEQFQQDSTNHGWPLVVDGEVGEKTWNATWLRPVS